MRNTTTIPPFRSFLQSFTTTLKSTTHPPMSLNANPDYYVPGLKQLWHDQKEQGYLRYAENVMERANRGTKYSSDEALEEGLNGNIPLLSYILRQRDMVETPTGPLIARALFNQIGCVDTTAITLGLAGFDKTKHSPEFDAKVLAFATFIMQNLERNLTAYPELRELLNSEATSIICKGMRPDNLELLRINTGVASRTLHKLGARTKNPKLGITSDMLALPGVFEGLALGQIQVEDKEVARHC